jgi:hypothetical protein
LCVRFSEKGYTLEETDEAVAWLYGVDPKTVSRWRGVLGESVFPYTGREPTWAAALERHGT